MEEEKVSGCGVLMSYLLVSLSQLSMGAFYRLYYSTLYISIHRIELGGGALVSPSRVNYHLFGRFG